jgi:Phosphatidylinositol N-acetylglucosaminyltransferase
MRLPAPVLVSIPQSSPPTTNTPVHTIVLLLLSLSTACLLQAEECLSFGTVLIVICGIAPVWKYGLQQRKRKISGPWDVVSLQEMGLE